MRNLLSLKTCLYLSEGGENLCLHSAGRREVGREAENETKGDRERVRDGWMDGWMALVSWYTFICVHEGTPEHMGART